MAQSAPGIVLNWKGDASGEELRYALRSLRNLEHDGVWIVGDPTTAPSWLTNVEWIPELGHPTGKMRSLYLKYRAVVDNDSLPDFLVYWSDDVYLLVEGWQPEAYHCGTLQGNLTAVTASKGSGNEGSWWRSKKATLDALNQAGIRDPFNFELHTPHPFLRSEFPSAIDGIGLRGRTLSGAFTSLPTAPVHGDVKAIERHEFVSRLGGAVGYGGVPMFLSSLERTFHDIGLADFVASQLPKGGPYERRHDGPRRGAVS